MNLSFRFSSSQAIADSILPAEDTGISTHVWIVSNRKPAHRKGKVQLIDASKMWQKMRKSLGSKRKGLPKANSKLRDTEEVPLGEDIHEYCEREVKPHVLDAWIDEEKTTIGYEIPFNRHFYVFKPTRELDEIDA